MTDRPDDIYWNPENRADEIAIYIARTCAHDTRYGHLLIMSLMRRLVTDRKFRKSIFKDKPLVKLEQ